MNGATVQDFKNRGFDYLIALDGEGGASNYSGPGYDNGYKDGFQLASWITFALNGIPHYIAIPFFRPEGTPRDIIHIDYQDCYWKGWIDGVLNVPDNNLSGFYWSLENAWMFNDSQIAQGTGISRDLFEEISNKIHQHGLEFIWIPKVHTLYWESTSVLSAKPLIDYIFIQPHYYQADKIPYINDRGVSEEKDYSYDVLKGEYFNMAVNKLGVYWEMEADEAVLGQCGNCRVCHRSDKSNLAEKCIGYVTEYIKAQIDNMGHKFKHRAYYFGTRLEVLDKLEDYSLSKYRWGYI
ncbi:DUF4855 domain-containing protein [Candidatus Aerophobetes bacterium]|nr:DUF4855 domain-containing protein [Candidatus Aerophobetes bacterium]